MLSFSPTEPPKAPVPTWTTSFCITVADSDNVDSDSYMQRAHVSYSLYNVPATIP